MPGPVPYPEKDLARPRSRRGGDVQEVTRGKRREVTIPRADPNWHPIAKRFWDGLKSSGQAEFYQNSDWAFAWSLCDDLSHYKRMNKRSGQMLQAIYSAMERLLVTEADRRRARIELEEPEDDAPSAAVLAIADYKRELGVM